MKSRTLKIYFVLWQSDEVELKLFVVDLASSLLNARNPRLHELTALMMLHQPDIVVGDFNAPRRSLAISPLPDGFVHAYEAAGSGWSYTWPVPCPVYAIDQCILGRRIVPLRYDLETTTCSDHRLQILDFTARGAAISAER